ncbi:MAG: hypothetical protein HY547_02870 [Elusimicrobia bacterium]|nr:hypothetical protein [Elusimicrobiota bacterium]
MKKVLRNSTARARLWALLFIFLESGCATISPYDPTSYKTATDIKAEALLLIQKAAEPPAAHKVAIEGLQIKIQQALEYEKGKGGSNSLTFRQWEKLTDPTGGLMGGFLKKWETENAGQSDAFIQGASKNISEAFDEIIRLERHKVKK